VLEFADPTDKHPDLRRHDKTVAEVRRLTVEAMGAGRQNPNVLLDEALSPGVPAWMGLRKHAIALHPLYMAPHLDSLGAGLTLADLDRPLVEGASAFEVLAHLRSPERSRRVRDRYAAFLLQPVTEALRAFMHRTLDARQIRWRAWAAALLAEEVAVEQWSKAEGLVVTSLACGAAGPVAKLVDGLASGGFTVAQMQLVDRDPVALAAGRAIAEAHLDPELIRVHLLDLVDLATGSAAPLLPHLEPQASHLVDILGLFEYLPDDTAVSLLREVRTVLRPDGAVVLANMLDVRPEQDVFDHVIQWPPLVQRSVDDLLALAGRGGFDVSRATVATAPQEEAVYAVALLRA
jgi:SAM-dependent methyltransferase